VEIAGSRFDEVSIAGPGVTASFFGFNRARGNPLHHPWIRQALNPDNRTPVEQVARADGA